MEDKKYICYSAICLMDPRFGYLERVDKKWGLVDNGDPLRKDLCAVADAGGNSLRLLSFAVYQEHPDGKESQFCPWVYDKAKGLWRLSERNDYYRPIVRRIVEIANECRLRVWWAFFDHCSFISGWWNAYNPWLHNVEGVPTIYDEAAYPYVKDMMETQIDDFRGLDVAYHLANEAGDGRMPDLAERVMFPVIRRKGLPLDRLGAGANLSKREYLGEGKYADKPVTTQDKIRERFGSYFGEANKKLLFREVHGVGNRLDKWRPFGDRIAQAVCWWSKPKQSEHEVLGDWIADTDGMKIGDSECDKDTDGSRPSAQTMHDMAVYLWKDAGVDNVHIAHCPQTTNIPCLVKTFKAISEAYKEVFGKYPANYGKVPYVPPVEPPPSPPPMVELDVCQETKLLPNHSCGKIRRQFIKGTEPTKVCPIHHDETFWEKLLRLLKGLFS